MINLVDEREKLGVAGKGVVDDFGWESMVNRYEEILCNVARRQTPQR
jgi:hypothetical protein